MYLYYMIMYEENQHKRLFIEVCNCMEEKKEKKITYYRISCLVKENIQTSYIIIIHTRNSYIMNIEHFYTMLTMCDKNWVKNKLLIGR